jgi:hypothetical protein
MATYLQLCSRLRQEVGYADAGPTAVTGQTGAHARCVSWIADAYTELQNRTLWNWLRRRFTFDTVASTEEYAYTAATDVEAAATISRFNEWLITDSRNPPRCYLASAGAGTEYWLTYVPWDYFRTIYRIGNQNEGAPAHISIDPATRKIVLGPVPNDVYRISGEYRRGPQILAANSDTPEMPSEYHMAIVYLAMVDAGMYEVANEIVNRGQQKARKLIRQLENAQTPRIRMAGPMA